MNTAAVYRAFVPVRLRRDPIALIALVFLFFLILAALLGPWLLGGDPYQSSLRLRLRPPSMQNPFGTDTQGRDLLLRVVYGLRMTLSIGLISVAIGGGIGAMIGIFAAYYAHLENLLMRFVDVLLSFPAILFGLALAAIIGPGLLSLVAALSIAAIPSIARIARGAATVVMQNEYIEGGRAIGLGNRALILRYVLANCAPTILIFFTLQLGQLILLGAALSFLGLGAQPPTAELGAMAAEGRDFFSVAPHIATIPSLVIFSIALSVNLLGDALRDMLDPKMRG